MKAKDKRTESDLIGEVSLPEGALYGIHSLRACRNFPKQSRFSQAWYRGIGQTKLACYQTYKKFLLAIEQKYPGKEIPLKFMDEKLINALIDSAIEVAEGRHFDHFIVPAVSGGAGTSLNMNINEIIANLSLLKLGHQPGDYSRVDPVEHANIYQSTNDVIPTALKVTLTGLLERLEEGINDLRESIEQVEQTHRNAVKIGYTEMQAAVPTSFGKVFSNYSEALSRDWWRISRCFERLKVVNLGGSALGTGIAVPQYFLMEAVNELRKLTGRPFTRGENMTDTTSNMDVMVEVHAIMKAHAVNLEKMSSDLRLMSSDLNGKKDIELPPVQTGSSVMPGKVNPVIPEYVISIAHKVYANDMLISNLAGQGCLDLNAYIPAIGEAMIESLELLNAANKTIKTNMISGIKVNTKNAMEKLYASPAVTTALLPFTGYHKAAQLAKHMKQHTVDIFKANQALHIIEPLRLEKIMKPENLIKAGFTIGEL
ncbi:MAG: lyase family protein [Bacteroidales bacterium]